MLKNKHAAHLPDVSRWTMLMAMLPEEVQQEVRDRKATLPTTPKVVDYINGELSRYQESWLSKIQDQIESKSFQQASENLINAVQETESPTSEI